MTSNIVTRHLDNFTEQHEVLLETLERHGYLPQ